MTLRGDFDRPVSAEPTAADPVRGEAIRFLLGIPKAEDRADYVADYLAGIRAAARAEGRQEGERIRVAVEAVIVELDEHPAVAFSAWAVADRLRAAVAPAQRSRAEEKRAALMEALEGLVAKYSTRYSLMDERDKAVEARRFARSIRAVLDEHR